MGLLSHVYGWLLVGLIALACGMLVSGCALNGGGLIATKASPPGGRITCAGACE